MRAPKQTRNRRWVYVAAWLFVLPALVAYSAFGWYPMVNAFIVAFQHYTVVGPATYVGFANFRELFQDSTALIALRNSLLWAALTLGLTFWPPIIVAVLLMEVSERARRLLMLLWFIPVPAVASTVILKYLYNQQYGLLNGIWTRLGLPPFQWLDSSHWTLFLIVLPGLVMYGPGLIYIATLQAVPQELYEAAELDGASFLRKVWAITLPTLRPIVTVMLLLSILASLQVFTQPYIMTAGGPGYASLTGVLYIFNTAFKRLQFGYADVLAITLFLILMIVVLIQQRLSRED